MPGVSCHASMKFIIILFVVLLSIYIVWEVLTRKYVNVYQLYLIFGHKGCGKSTLLQKLAIYYKKKGYHIYCNAGDSDLKEVCAIPIEYLPKLSLAAKDKELQAQLADEFKEKGIVCPPFVKRKSVILVDEINLLWDNRDFKNFPKDMQRYFRLQRHYQHIFIGFSQTYDCDKKIRDLADYLLICRKKFRVWIRTTAYYKDTRVLSPSSENSREAATMTDDFLRMGFFFDLFSPFQAWLPKWVKFHDSYK